MQYNTQRIPLVMPEYGRGVQEMVNLAINLPTRQQRLRCTKTIVSIMARVQPQQAGQVDFKQRLWNHLAKIARYQLDIDYPVEIIPEETLGHPAPLHYPTKDIQRRHYGYLVEESLRKAQSMPEGEKRDKLVEMLANQMKQDLFMWNRDSMDEALVARDISNYTDGLLKLNLQRFHFAPVGVPNLRQVTGNSSRSRNKKKR